MTALLIDLSHHNAIPNWPVLKTAVAGVIAKASEGTDFADPAFPAIRTGAEANGLALGAYHFARLLDPATEARWFVRCLGGALRPGEFVGLDLEVTAAGVDPVAWTGRWLDAMAALGVPVRLLYLNRTELAAYNWQPIVARGVQLWLAAYDGQRTPVASGAWPVLTLKQFTDAGTVPGETGAVDVDVLFGSLTDLTGADMPLTPQDVTAVAQAVWAYNVSGKGVQAQDRLYGIDAVQLPGITRTLNGTAAAVAALLAKPGVSAADIAAAIPAGMAQQVVVELGKIINAAPATTAP